MQHEQRKRIGSSAERRAGENDRIAEIRLCFVPSREAAEINIMVLVGFFCAVLSAICNGTFGSLSKLERCSDVHPYIFNFWTCQGIVISCGVWFLVDFNHRVYLCKQLLRPFLERWNVARVWGADAHTVIYQSVSFCRFLSLSPC